MNLYLRIFYIISLIISHNIDALDDKIKQDIKHLVANNPNQLVEVEYTLIVEKLINKSPCNMLVFGVGRDSKLWIESNFLGQTIFLEDNKTWFNRICSEIPQINACLVQYNTKRKDWQYWLEESKAQELLLDLPSEIMETKWDIIFVDGPEGWSDDKPGRMKSIFTAAYLAYKSENCHVFVHDCDRPVEAIYSSMFLMDENLECTLCRLRHYFIP